MPALILGVTVSLLAACGGSSQTRAPASAAVTTPQATFSVAGRVSGLSGAGLSLSLNNGPALAIASDGAFVFPSEASQRFTVTVASPASDQT